MRSRSQSFFFLSILCDIKMKYKKTLKLKVHYLCFQNLNITLFIFSREWKIEIPCGPFTIDATSVLAYGHRERYLKHEGVRAMF